MPCDASALPELAARFLQLTDESKHYIRWWKERAWARNIILRCRRRPSYLLTVDGLEDFYRAEDLLAETVAQAAGAPAGR